MEFLTSPLLEFLGVLNAEQALMWSYLTASVSTAPLWVVAGIQDHNKCEVSGWVCLLLLLFMAAHAILFVNWFVFLFVLILFFFTFGPLELSKFGQADFVMMGHLLTTYFVYRSGSGMFVVAGVILIIVLLAYIKLYKGPKGEKWRMGTLVPVISPYAISVCITMVIQYPISRKLFFAGW